MAASIASRVQVLADILPEVGFKWKTTRRGAPKVMRSEDREEDVYEVMMYLFRNKQTKKSRKYRPRPEDIASNALAVLNQAFKGGDNGFRPEEDILDFLGRAQGFVPLAAELTEDVWIEFVYQLVAARERYIHEVPGKQRYKDLRKLTGLADEVDWMLRTAGRKWDRLTLEIIAYPHLMGEESDYEISDDDEDSEESGEDDGEEDSEC
ncbi:hypothetical protein B0H67DRAFT_120166 [Lasiosphaeris hirsuta]|uniref:Uncharacterized protein n=1 Tax=Lasiosphaeris hirsuta TaxID=260670 RepID=A0AA40E5U5_9PEZI|nr:hypothetical protein B0H67DRAFT_120166 [Lasiosphaeris hirsuta]